MSSNCDPMEKLAAAVDSMAAANKAWRDVIQFQDEEIGRLEHFDGKFRTMKDEFIQFKELANKHDKQANELQFRLHQEQNRHRKTTENLRDEIEKMNKAIDELSSENNKLECDLKQNVENWQKLQFSNDHSSAYANTFPIISSPDSFIQRLCDDYQ